MSYTFYQYNNEILDNVQYSMLASTELRKYNKISIDVFNYIDGKIMIYIAEHPKTEYMMILSEYNKILSIYFGAWERLKKVFMSETGKCLEDYIKINQMCWDMEEDTEE